MTIRVLISDKMDPRAAAIFRERGIDVDAIIGYDFGMFRLEGEIGYKRAKVDDFEIDNSDIAALNATLNRPSGLGDPGTPVIVTIDEA